MSNTLPWRTLATPATPSDLSAPSIALPWGSRMPILSVTVTRAFIALLVRHVDNGESRRPQPGLCVGEGAKLFAVVRWRPTRRSGLQLFQQRNFLQWSTWNPRWPVPLNADCGCEFANSLERNRDAVASPGDDRQAEAALESGKYDCFIRTTIRGSNAYLASLPSTPAIDTGSGSLLARNSAG